MMPRTRLFAALAHVFGFAPGMVLALALAMAPSAALAQRSDNPHGPQIGACATCHSATAWKPVQVSRDFRHAEQTFPLEGAHVRTACTACHKTLVFTGTPSACASCHSDVHKGEFGTACARCHNSRSFTDEAPMRRAHELTRFPLRGAHATASCASCHTPSEPGQPQFANRPTACAGCHEAAFRATKAPDHLAARFSRDCATCHGVVTWSDAKFDHSTTRFALSGAHRAVGCSGCHADKVFTGKSMECVGCHRSDFERSVNPPHRNGFPTACASCHSTVTWHDAKFDHSSTAFALTGAHVTALCSACHADGVYKGKPATCVSCHQAKYNGALLPPHSALGFSTACAACHTTVTWTGGTFDHATTRFPLTGAHRTAACKDCHADGVYRGKTVSCSGCHMAKYTASTKPSHTAGGFPTSCELCHTTTQWTPAVFDHSTTAFPLTGAHKTAICSACHGDGVYKGRSTACISCHQANYAGAALPPHSVLGFSTACATCHTTVTWAGGTFDHATTRFPLTGAHRTATCKECHADGVYRGKTMACSGCHLATYTATSKPNHAAAGFPTACETCHTTTRWTGAVFNHAATAFPLSGAHATALCSACHADGVYKGKPTACISCHQANYNGANLPPHSALGFSTACATCHTTVTWTGGTFDHATTRFPLTGAHRTATCKDCHADGVYRGKTMVCSGCHMATYTATSKPNHAASGFPTTCEMCHTTTQWTGAVFNHAATAFPLSGAHATALCAACHADGVYKGKPTTCISCHQPDYNTASLPPHSTLGFSTVCSTCHTTVTWAGGTFDHATTRFPLTGAHRAAPCADCHGDGVYRGKTMVCSGCHMAKYTATTNPPHAAAGFPTTCETCHTTTRWTGAVFNHSTTRFPLTGAHVPLPCSSCHADGVYRGKTMVCSGCHLAKYNATTNPNHAAANFPTNCESCHTTSTWLGATFNHDGSFFPIYSGKHKGRWSVCADCHTSPSNFAVFTCLTCHAKPKMDSAHSGRSGYRYDSPTCYSCHPKGSAG